MANCECGCGEQVIVSQFLPGHDQRLRTSLEAEVGGILEMRSLLRAAKAYYSGEISDQAFTQTVRATLARAKMNP